MAGLLARLGRACFRHRWAVLAGWVLSLVAVATLSVLVARPESTQFSIPGTQSQRAMDLLEQKFPQASGATAQVVFAAPAGTTLRDPGVQAGVESSLAEARRAAQVVLVLDPYSVDAVSKDGRIAYATVVFKVPASAVTQQAKDELAASAEPARKVGVTVAFGGGIVSQPTAKGSDAVGLLVAYLVLAVTFGSMLAAGLPLLSALVGVGIGLTGINALGGFISLSATAPILATMLGLAVAIDYSLFIVHRYREQLGSGLSPEDAATRAVGSAGLAVAFAGTTVIVALAGLAVAGIPFLTVMGLCAAGAVAVAVAVALTFVPAMLGLAARRIRPPRRRKGRRSLFSGWVGGTTRHPMAVLVTGVVLLVLAATPLLRLDLGLPSAGTLPKGQTARVAYDLMARGFGPGVNAPLLVVVDSPRAEAATVLEIARPLLEKVPGVASVGVPQQNATKDVTVLVVTPKTGPSTEATRQLVGTIRSEAQRVTRGTGISVMVTGPTALNIDISTKLGDALLPYLLVVVGIASLLLLVVFRSILVPVKAVLGFLFSVAATLGIVVFVFEQGHLGSLVLLPAASPVVSFLPLMMVGILFGLAMDYEVFLVTRMREAQLAGLEPTEAVRRGFSESAPVVMAAATIMFSVFASYVVEQDLVTKEMAFSLAVGVLIDALVVRMTLVPAAMALLGRSAWWLPGPLERHLPRLDLEGSALDAPQSPAG